MRRIGLVVVALLLLSTAAALAFAPYLPRLVAEGVPTLVWRGVGETVEVIGAASPRDLGPSVDRPLDAQSSELFAGSDGAALLLARSGQIALEHYAEANGAETRFNSFSMVKSLIGALVFKALAEGKLSNLDQTLGELLPEAPGLSRLTLRRLLTMRAGVHFDSRTTSFGAPGSVKDSETFPNPFGPIARLYFEGIETIEAGLSMDAVPPEAFTYQNVNTALLGAVLERLYGERLETLLSEKIWAPAGAETALWHRPQADRSVSAFCCLYATARNWIRIGLFFAENGSPEHPFLPEPLWREFLGLDVPLEERSADHYGNHTLQNVLDREGEALQGPFSYFMGQNGQILYIMPEEDLVVYRAGEHFALLHSTLYGAWNSAMVGER
jgi:CubicO group peptidase (beta-lactamase class C family)